VFLDAQKEDQPALTRAAYLSRATGAKLHLFICAYDAAVALASFLTGSERDGFVRTIVDGNQALLDRLAQPLIDQGLVVTTEVVWNRHPVDEVINSVVASDADLFMKKAQGHSRVAEVMFSHVDWNLMRYCPCPVMLVKDGQWDEVGQVLAAVDAAPHNEEHERLNREILDTSKYLAETLDFELHLVSAYPPPPVFVPISSGAQVMVNYRSKMSSMVTANVGLIAEEYGVDPDHVHTVEGPVDWVISSVSADLVAEFVVMGNAARQTLSGRSLGSSAEDVLDQLNTNVLMVKVSEKSE